MSRHSSIAGLPLVLGANVFGWTAEEDASFAVLDRFYEAGGRMVDTAQMYAGTKSETIIGKWLQSRGTRSEMKIATKVNPMGTPGLLAPAHVAAELEQSLGRLQTDYVDLYYAHRDEPQTPQEEVAAGFEALVKAGKVRELGASNYTPERLRSAIEAARRIGATPFSVIQNEYNLIVRDRFEGAMQELCLELDIAGLPYFSLASGYLTGKYRSEADLEQSARGKFVGKYLGQAPRVLEALRAVSTETGAAMPAIALAWLRAQPGVSAPLASARTVEQVDLLIASATLELDPKHLQQLTAAGT